MRNSMFDRVKGFNFRFSRVAVAVVASFVLLLGTGCNPSSPSVSGTGSYQEGRPTQTELYKPNQAKQGGMNTYSDTDARQNTRGLAAETKARVDQAKGNLKKSNSPAALADEVKDARPLKEGPKDVSKRASNTVEDVTQDLKAGTERGIQNLKANAKQAKRGIEDTLDDARQNAADLGKDTARGAQATANELKRNVDDAARDLSNKVSGQVSKTGASGDLTAVRSGKQSVPDLDADDLAERAKNVFGAASRNVGDFAKE
ncbi:MAG: hypothetical protein ACKO7W_25030 [Elainella sp.]